MLRDWLYYLQDILQTVARHSFLFLIYGVLLFLFLLWYYRKLSILETGGHFWDPYHITGDILYIHSGLFCIGRRDIPFSEMRIVHIFYTREKWEDRYTVQIHREKGLYKFFFLPVNEKGRKQLKELERVLFQHRITVKKWGY